MPRIPSHSKNVNKLLKSLNQESPDQRIQVPVRLTHLREGNIVIFKYPDNGNGPKTYKMSLIVINDTGRITYTSLRRNRLLSTFKLDSSPDVVVNYIMKNLYKNRKLAIRKVIVEGLAALLGNNNYRTYNLNKIEDLSRLEIIKANLPDMDQIHPIDFENY